MKTILIFLTTIFFSFTILNGDDKTERIGVPGPLEFNKTTFKLIWTDKPNENYYIQEYIPEGETIEQFNQMMTIHLFATSLNVKEAVQQRLSQLDERKKTDPNCLYQVFNSSNGKESIIDCMLGEHNDRNLMTIIEWNLYKYKQVEFGKKKKGVIVYAYTKRAYGDYITPFLKSLKEIRTDYLNEMISTEVPKIKLNDN